MLLFLLFRFECALWWGHKAAMYISAMGGQMITMHKFFFLYARYPTYMESRILSYKQGKVYIVILYRYSKSLSNYEFIYGSREEGWA